MYIPIYLIIFIYIVITLATIYYTYNTMNSSKYDYVSEVHGHMASIMMFHILIVSIVITVKPSFLDNIYFSIINTLLSIMFSILFYMTDKNSKKLLYTYNTLYLIFASILMSEIILYFNNDKFVYSFMLIYSMFIIDILFHTESRQVPLMMIYILMSIFACITTLILFDTKLLYAYILSSVYALIVIGYMYYDIKYLKTTKTSSQQNHLDDALKYFLDFEGFVIRSFDKYFEKQQ